MIIVNDFKADKEGPTQDSGFVHTVNKTVRSIGHHSHKVPTSDSLYFCTQYLRNVCSIITLSVNITPSFHLNLNKANVISQEFDPVMLLTILDIT